MCQHLTVARVAEGLGVSPNTANDAVLAEGRRVLIDNPRRFDGVRVIGVDEPSGGTSAAATSLGSTGRRNTPSSEVLWVGKRTGRWD